MNYVKQYFWPIHFALVTLVAYLGAGAANKMVAAKLFDAPKAHLAPAPKVRAAASPKSRPLAYYAGIAKRNVFNSKAAPEDAEGGSAAKGEAKPAAAAEKEYGELEDSALGLLLKGTWVSAAAADSFAILEDPKAPDKDKQKLYRMDDAVQDGVTLVKVEKLRVVLDNKGRLEEIEFHRKDEKPKPPPGPPVGQPATPSAADLAGEVGAGVRQTGANSYEVPEGEIDKALSNLNGLLTQARVVPNFENGVTDGFKVFAIRPNSIFEKLGVKNGDVISKINNIEINSPDKAFALLTQLRNEKTLTMEVKRGGGLETFTYNIQ